jgi:hypothetical protein
VWTYTGDPTVSDVAAVRFEIQDTDVNAPLLQDEEIAYAILQETTVAAGTPQTIVPPYTYLAAARCLEALSRRFAAQADSEIGSLKLTYSKQAVNYATRAAEMRAKGAGGFSPESTQKHHRPAFRRDQFDTPYASGWLDNGLGCLDNGLGLPMPCDET